MQNIPKDRLILSCLGRIISLGNHAQAALSTQRREACGKRIMKGRAMNIKLVEQGRTATYGITLGVLLFALWRGIVRLFAAGIPTRAACAAGVDRCDSDR